MKKYLQNLSYLAVLGIASMCLFSSCAKYKAHKLGEPVGIAHEKNNVQITAEALTNADCHHYFSRRSAKKGLGAIHLCIKNNSDQTYVLDAKKIEIQIEDRRNVAHALHLNTACRVISWGIPGIFLWPFFIPAAIEGVKSSTANKQLDHDFNQRVLSHDSRLVITPHSSINKVFFVATENFRNSFGLMLDNMHSTESLSFTINL